MNLWLKRMRAKGFVAGFRVEKAYRKLHLKMPPHVSEDFDRRKKCRILQTVVRITIIGNERETIVVVLQKEAITVVRITVRVRITEREKVEHSIT